VREAVRPRSQIASILNLSAEVPELSIFTGKKFEVQVKPQNPD
jgi:hypothetical protein